MQELKDALANRIARLDLASDPIPLLAAAAQALAAIELVDQIHKLDLTLHELVASINDLPHP